MGGARPWEVQLEFLKAKGSKAMEKVLDDEERQERFWRRRLVTGFAVNKKEHTAYILEFKRVSDAGERYVTETQRVAEL